MIARKAVILVLTFWAIAVLAEDESVGNGKTRADSTCKVLFFR